MTDRRSKTSAGPCANAEELRRQLRAMGDPAIAEHSQRFFKTGPGEYGQGDRFIGVRVPVLRRLASRSRGMPLSEVESILHSKIHEERLLALLILVLQYQKGDEAARQAVFETYLDNLEHINNWDLVDSSAYKIVGQHLLSRSTRLLHRLAASDSLWERRIAIMSTLAFIKNDRFEETLGLAEKLLQDGEDLIQKAVGWMLREVGNRDRAAEEAFLVKHCRHMPRTMLRYAIEKFPEPVRKRFLSGDI